MRAVGTALGVGSVLEGSVRREGDRLRISAQLVDTREGFHLWSKAFDRRLNDVFAIQQEIAEAVVEAVRGEVGEGPAPRVPAPRRPADFRAYELYLRGIGLASRRGDVAAMREATALLEEATRIDPRYAPAHAGLAEAYYALWDFVPLFGRVTEPSLDRALESARRAAQLDPGLADAHAVLGWILSFRHDWPSAVASLERATELDPASARAHRWLATVLLIRGDGQRALFEYQLALRLDPVSSVVNSTYGRALLTTGQLDEGIARLRYAVLLNPSNELARFLLAWAYHVQGRDRAAAEVLLALSPRPVRPLLRATTRLFGLDFLVRALHTLSAWHWGDSCLVRGYGGASMLAFLGDREGALRCLEETHGPGIGFSKVDPWFDPYRDDPRFQALLARVGLAD